MIKVDRKIKDNLLVLKIKLSSDDIINSPELEYLTQYSIRGVLRPALIKKNVLEYTGAVCISLAEWLKKPVPEYNFLFVMERVVDLVHRLQEINLTPGKVLWDINSVFLNESTGDIQVIYLPFTSEQSESNVLDLLYTVSETIIPVPGRDTGFATRFTDHLMSMPMFDAYSIENYIASVDIRVVNSVKGIAHNTQVNNSNNYSNGTNNDIEHQKPDIQIAPTPKPIKNINVAMPENKAMDIKNVSDNDDTWIILSDEMQ